jgi:hypothetical protein
VSEALVGNRGNLDTLKLAYNLSHKNTKMDTHTQAHRDGCRHAKGRQTRHTRDKGTGAGDSNNGMCRDKQQEHACHCAASMACD